MVTSSLLEDFYREWKEQTIENIRFLQRSMGETAAVREMFPDDWEITELCSHIIFLGHQNILVFAREAEHARTAHEKLAGI